MAHIWSFTPETLPQMTWQCGFVQVQGTDPGHTSFVLRRRRATDAAPEGANPALAERVARQVATEGRPLTCSRYATVREMADAVLARADPVRPPFMLRTEARA